MQFACLHAGYAVYCWLVQEDVVDCLFESQRLNEACNCFMLKYFCCISAKLFFFHKNCGTFKILLWACKPVWHYNFGSANLFGNIYISVWWSRVYSLQLACFILVKMVKCILTATKQVCIVFVSFDCHDFPITKQLMWHCSLYVFISVRMDARGRCDVLWQAEVALRDTCYSAYHVYLLPFPLCCLITGQICPKNTAGTVLTC